MNRNDATKLAMGAGICFCFSAAVLGAVGMTGAGQSKDIGCDLARDAIGLVDVYHAMPDYTVGQKELHNNGVKVRDKALMYHGRYCVGRK